MFAGLEGGFGDGGMPVIRSRDDDGVEILLRGEQLAIVGVSADVFQLDRGVLGLDVCLGAGDGLLSTSQSATTRMPQPMASRRRERP